MVHLVALILMGFLAGLLSGVVGIGGGIVLVPAMVFFLGYSQHLAQGTSLAALILPVGLMSVMVYWKNGHVDLRSAGVIAVTMFFGAYFGALIAARLSSQYLQRGFGLLLVVVGFKFLFGR